jgi:hypothetical protein
MSVIRFQTNIPQAVRLIRLEGRSVDSQFGGTQSMFMAQEGAFYVSDKVGAILADQFAKLGVQPGQAIEITKAEVGRGPERRTQWIVATTEAREEGQPVATGALVVPKLPEPPSQLEGQLAASIRMVEERKQAQSAMAAAPAWASFLVAQSNALIDCYRQVLTHASQYPTSAAKTSARFSCRHSSTYRKAANLVQPKSHSNSANPPLSPCVTRRVWRSRPSFTSDGPETRRNTCSLRKRAISICPKAPALCSTLACDRAASRPATRSRSRSSKSRTRTPRGR